MLASDKHTGNIASYNKLALLTDPICEKNMRGFAPRFCKRVATTASLSLENMPGTHAGSGSPRRRFSINGILHMEVVLGETITSKVNVTLFLFTLDAGAAFLSGKNLTQSVTLSEVLFFTDYAF